MALRHLRCRGPHRNTPRVPLSKRNSNRPMPRPTNRQCSAHSSRRAANKYVYHRRPKLGMGSLRRRKRHGSSTPKRLSRRTRQRNQRRWWRRLFHHPVYAICVPFRRVRYVRSRWHLDQGRNRGSGWQPESEIPFLNPASPASCTRPRAASRPAATRDCIVWKRRARRRNSGQSSRMAARCVRTDMDERWLRRPAQ